MITKDSVVIGGQPRINALRFGDILLYNRSPAFSDAFDMFNAIVAEGVCPAFLLAVFKKESRYATDPNGIVVRYQTFNMGNCRSSRIGVTETITDPVRGTFVKYKDWATGARDAAHRLVDKNFNYARAGATTIEQIISIWAPPAENDTEKYIADVILTMNSWIGSSSSTMNLKIALAAGHHNSDGGSPLEASITGPLCEAYYTAFKAAGVDVRVITPDGPDADTIPGDGMYPGGLQDVAQQVVNMSNQGWTADLFLECHTQGLANTGVRGCFAIYPDWGGDLDLTVKNSLGKRIVQAISAASGIPVYEDGLMSEKSTGVGISGYRLGIFLRTAPVAAKTTRLIVEHGAHTNKQDLAILQSPGMLDKIASAGAKAIIEHFEGSTTTPPSDNRINGFVVGGGFGEFYKKLAGVSPNFELLTLGYPLTEEFDCDVNGDNKLFTVQLFQRAALIYESANAAPWDVHTTTIRQLAAIVDAARNKSLVILPTA
jgi:N-acetylmuramoyl-L-alanine amidase